MNVEVFESDSVEATEAFGRDFAPRLSAGDCVAMRGQLGAGKTVLARGLAAGLGVADTASVCSPTYVLVHEYSGRVRMYHLDLYRLRGGDEFVDLGVDEMLGDGVVVIEWPERAEVELPRRRWEISIEITGPAGRRISARQVG